MIRKDEKDARNLIKKAEFAKKKKEEHIQQSRQTPQAMISFFCFYLHPSFRIFHSLQLQQPKCFPAVYFFPLQLF